MIEIDCRKCKSSTNDGCMVYGTDAEVAVKECANSQFKYYKDKNAIDEYKMRIAELQAKIWDDINNPTARSPLGLSTEELSWVYLGLGLLRQ